jgi:hypothetical protein
MLIASIVSVTGGASVTGVVATVTVVTGCNDGGSLQMGPSDDAGAAPDADPRNPGADAAEPDAATPEELPDVPLSRAWSARTWIVYYGGWDVPDFVARASRYDLVILDANRGGGPDRFAFMADVIRSIRVGADGKEGTADDTIVLGYISIGEDLRTYNRAAPIVGDGKGPVYLDPETNTFIEQNRGVASYYLDEKQSDAYRDFGHDGQPDRHGTWGACYVNVGHPEWQNYLLGEAEYADRTNSPYSTQTILDTLGFDGLFLDTPEVADPWNGWGYTAEGIYNLIKRMDEKYPDKLLLLNRGLFFFLPHYPFQYKWSPRKHIDLLLVESHYLDSDYHIDNTAFRENPFHTLLTNFVDPKLEAEAGRPDNPIRVLSLDYAAEPDVLPAIYPDTLTKAVETSTLKYGRPEFITDRLVSTVPDLFLNYAIPPDAAAPIWGNTTGGFTAGSINPSVRFYMNLGNEDRYAATEPRVGIQEALPGDGKVTVRWDVAYDQTGPVKYNVYYSTATPIDFATAQVAKHVRPTIPDTYTSNRNFLSTDTVTPYEVTIDGLDNGTTYYFAVRAEDRTSDVVPETGRVGPGGGIEDTNTVELPATPIAQ